MSPSIGKWGEGCYGRIPMTAKARAGMDGLILRVQAALSLATKKEAECLVNVFISCLEDTLVDHLADDGYCLKLNGVGKLVVRHSPSIRKRVGFNGETCEIPPKRKVNFLVLGKLRQLERVKH